MPKKKLLVFLLTAILLFSLAGCTSSQSTYQKETYQAQVSTQAQSQGKEPGHETEINLIKTRVTKAVDGDTVYVRFESGREKKFALSV